MFYYLSGMKMMPLIMLSCSRTLAMLGAVNWEMREKSKNLVSSLTVNHETDTTTMSTSYKSPSGA